MSSLGVYGHGWAKISVLLMLIHKCTTSTIELRMMAPFRLAEFRFSANGIILLVCVQINKFYY